MIYPEWCMLVSATMDFPNAETVCIRCAAWVFLMSLDMTALLGEPWNIPVIQFTTEILSKDKECIYKKNQLRNDYDSIEFVVDLCWKTYLCWDKTRPTSEPEWSHINYFKIVRCGVSAVSAQCAGWRVEYKRWSVMWCVQPAECPVCRVWIGEVECQVWPVCSGQSAV